MTLKREKLNIRIHHLNVFKSDSFYEGMNCDTVYLKRLVLLLAIAHRLYHIVYMLRGIKKRSYDIEAYINLNHKYLG